MCVFFYRLWSQGDRKDSNDVYKPLFYKLINQPSSQTISVPPCLLFHLQRLEWEGYNGQREEERQVATYILTNAKHLTKANISTKNKYFTPDEKLEMLKDLAREPKASTSCYFFFE